MQALGLRAPRVSPWLALVGLSCSSLLGIEEPVPRNTCQGDACAGEGASLATMGGGGAEPVDHGGSPAMPVGGQAGSPPDPSVAAGAAGSAGDGPVPECEDEATRCLAYQPQLCKSGIWASAGSECPGFCEDGECREAKSCKQSSPCVDGASCCDTIWMDGGTYEMSQGDGDEPDVTYTRYVSGFYLDRFEVTLDRFEEFVAKYSLPDEGAGAHPRFPGSGWHKSWEQLENPDRAGETAVPGNTNELITQLSEPDQCAMAPTWGASDAKLPINCVNWFVALAFCAFDGGRLPTEAEWNYAASHGDGRPYPWSASPSDLVIDATHASYAPEAMPSPVGSHPAGQGGFFRNPGQGHEDLAGNVGEWTLDQWLETPPESCEQDCVAEWEDIYRVVRGGAFAHGPSSLRSGHRSYGETHGSEGTIGFRCARDASSSPEEPRL